MAAAVTTEDEEEDGDEDSSPSFAEGAAKVKILSSSDKNFLKGEIYDFADINDKIARADRQQHQDRIQEGFNGEWTKKLHYKIYLRHDGEDYEFSARYDIGDGDGTLLNHLKTLGAVFYNKRLSTSESIEQTNKYRCDMIPLLENLVEQKNENAAAVQNAVDNSTVNCTPRILWGEDESDEWFTESRLLYDFVKTEMSGNEVSFALANRILEFLDEKQHYEREDNKHGWYDKTFFRVAGNINGEEWCYNVRYDIGDGKGSGGGSIIDHIRLFNTNLQNYEQAGLYSAEDKAEAKKTLDVFVPYLEEHSALTEEEQAIYDRFVSDNPLETAVVNNDTSEQNQSENQSEKPDYDNIAVGSRLIREKEIFEVTAVSDISISLKNINPESSLASKGYIGNWKESLEKDKWEIYNGSPEHSEQPVDSPAAEQIELTELAEDTVKNGCSYAVGDTVYLDNKAFQIEDIGLFDIQMRDLSSAYPIFRAENKHRFENMLRWDDRNKQFLPRGVQNEAADIDISEAEIIQLPPAPMPVQIPKAQTAHNFHLNEGESIDYATGAKAKYRDNITAIRTLLQIEKEKRTATPEEQQILSKYVGWGGLSDAFDKNKTNWSREYIELKSLLSEKEYNAAFLSTNSAFYTDPELIRPIWSMLQRFGFTGGEILEPSCGVGAFFSVMPQEIADNSHLHGIELDSITGRIAKQLYPTAQIKINSYQNVYIDNDSIDIAVGNVPFENIRVTDLDRNSDFLLHDYFFIKTIDKLKPGGIAAFITSSGTLDKTQNGARIEMAKKADLLAAVRLPDNAFRAIAGTETVADLVILQKREETLDEQTIALNDSGRFDWTHSQWSSAAAGITGILSGYFLKHKEMILGELAKDWRGLTCKAKDGVDLHKALNETLKTVDARFTAEPTPPDLDLQEEETDGEICIDAPDDAENLCYYVNTDGRVYYCENEHLTQYSGTAKNEQIIKAMCQLRDKLQTVIDVQLNSDGNLSQAQKELNETYDAFVKKYGNLNNPVNTSAFREDLKCALLLSLEEETGENEYKKSDIFTKATISPEKNVESAETAQEALILSLNARNAVDLPYMSGLLGKPEDEIIAELKNAVYQDPSEYASPFSSWKTAEEYLSGDVVEKLSVAQEWAKEYPDLFERNVTALLEVQPTRIGIEDIDYSLGQPYIPVSLYEEFCTDKFGVMPNRKYGGYAPEMTYTDALNSWKVTKQNFHSTDELISGVYGTERATAWKLLECSLNQQRIVIKDPYTATGANGQEAVRYKTNDEQTKIAQNRQHKIENDFKEWILEDGERVKTIEDNYNDRYNRLRPRTFDGSYIHINGLASDISLRPHQLNAVAKIAAGGCVMLAHEVGAGKTATMAAAGMYLKQMGVIKKPLYVVPKPIVAQWGREFARFFPLAKVLVTGEKDFEKKNRRRFLGKIATGDFDAVIMSQSQFEKIPLSVERQQYYLEQKQKDIEEAIIEIRREKGQSTSVKQLAAMRKQIQKQIEKLKADGKKDVFLTFEKLGCDYIFVDEAHAYKNLGVQTRHSNVAGLSASVNSQRAFDMEMKVKYLQKLNNGGGVTFATGTPLSNSISECFIFQHFLQPQLLQQANIEKFDKWSHVFAEIDIQPEAKPTGDGYRMRERFSAFKNLFELSTMLSESFDIVKNNEVNEIELPQIRGGKPEMVICELSGDAARQVEIAMQRAQAIEEKKVSLKEDNMLAICTDMTKISLDPRINDPAADDEECLKVNVCAKNIIAIDKENPGTTQVVFCDSSIPNGKNFSVYTELKKKLVSSGHFSENEIKFIHDAKNDKERLAMFDKVNKGEIRVIIGSTGKLGTGVNMQRKLIAAHHLDAPYVPKDVEQRNGRIVRQGNENKEVRILYYSTKGTFDSYRWQLLEKKQRLISQIMSGKPVSRRCQDIDDAALTYAEMKAATAGNPLIAEKMTIENDIETLKILRREYIAKQREYRHNIDDYYPEQISRIRQRIENLKHDIEVSENNPLPKDGFEITIDGKDYYERKEAGQQIQKIWLDYKNDAKNDKPSNVFGKFRGFNIRMFTHSVGTVLQLQSDGGKLLHEVEYTGSDTGTCIRLENLVENHLSALLQDSEKDLQTTLKNLETSKIEVTKPFEKAEELNSLEQRLENITLQLEAGKIQPSDGHEEIINTVTSEI